MKSSFCLLLGILLTVGVMVNGCSDDDPVTPDPGFTSELPFPANPFLLMENFSSAYESKDLDEFEYLLHADFKSILASATIEEWAQSTNPLTESFFSRDVEIQIHENIFSEIPA